MDELFPGGQQQDFDMTKFLITHDQLVFEKRIGSGAFGEVSVGIFKPTGAKVAIKKFHMVEDNKRSRELYCREVKCLAMYKHRFLLPFIGYTDTQPFCIVTKYIANGSLYNALHNKSVELNSTDLTLIAYGISSAMQYLHSNTIIHRDLKTQNVLIDEHKFPVIADFGSSRKIQGEAMTGSVGTLNYMAPEFFQGEDYNEKVDVYSFGLILWEMLTKEVPFDNMEYFQIIYQVVIQQSRPMIPKKTPPNLAKLIESCWSLNPSERPSFEQITPLFESGIVEFPDCDRQRFNVVLSSFSSQQKFVRRHSNSNLLLSNESMNNIPMFREERTIRSSTVLIPQSLENICQRANEFLYALNTNNANRIRQAFEFFENLVDDPNILAITVWPQFLLFLCSDHPSELMKRGESLCLRFAKNYGVLEGVSQVADLAQFVKPNTLDLFLYIINFLPGVVDKSIVKKLFELFSNQSCSKKAITLVCKILKNSQHPTITESILKKFKRDVLKYVNVPGSDLIIKTLVFYKLIQPEAISAFSESAIEDNVIAAYQSLFSIKGPPELFSLSNILSHVTSSNEQLRNEGLEFIRRYADNADGEPLFRLTLALFEAAIKYESEKAALLLVRIAENPEKCIYIFKVGLVDTWFQVKPNIAVNLLKLYIASILSDDRANKFMIQHPHVSTFFANILRSKNEDASVAACWALTKSGISKNLAKSLLNSEFVSMLCDIMSNGLEMNPDRYIHLLACLNLISQHVYHEKYNDVSKVIMKMIENKISIAHYCIATLASLSQYNGVFNTFVDENIVAILNGYTDNGESKKYQRTIFSNLKKYGMELPL